MVCTLARSVSPAEVNAAFAQAAAEPRLAGILAVTEVPLVSSDIIGRPQSCVFSACDTMVNGNRVKALGWYDNEWGYANRLIELASLMGRASTQRGERLEIARPDDDDATVLADLGLPGQIDGVDERPHLKGPEDKPIVLNENLVRTHR